MLEVLRQYLDTFQKEYDEISNKDLESEILAKVEEYKVKVKQELEAERQDKLHDKALEIKAVKRILENENKEC